jgi:Spy/CpxP family protein refolding chaperone
MRFARALAACALLTTLVILSSDGLMSQDRKDTGKIKGQLPQGWSKLDLTPAQKEEVYKLNREYKEKTDKLREEIRKLDEELTKKRVAVLSDEQRKKLIELVAGEPKEKAKDKSKSKEPDKK